MQLDLPNGYYELPPGKMANVVTCLELTLEDQAPTPLPPPLELTPFGPEAIESYRRLFRQVGEPWLWFSRLVMPDAELRARLADPAIFIAALVGNAEPLGLLELDFREPATCEIVSFGLLPSQAGQGLGRRLMTGALALAAQRGARRVWLHTCTFDSPQAIPFYLRCGFRAYARMVELHDDPRLTGKLPADAAPQIPVIPPIEKSPHP